MQNPTIWPAMIAIVGVLLAIVSLSTYPIILESIQVIATGQIDQLEEIAYATLISSLVGIVMAFYGLTVYLRRVAYRYDGARFSRLLSSVTLALKNKKSSRVFLIAASGYALLFMFISSNLVFQPASNFSIPYGVGVPSVVPVLCCGAVGQTPQFAVYITRQLALLVIPLNLILVITVSWLVGLNAALIAYGYAIRLRPVTGKWFAGLGGIVGLFTICPSCAGFLFLEVFGLSGAAFASLTLAALQGMFVLVGIPLLLVALFLSARQVSTSCGLEQKSDGVRLKQYSKSVP